MKKAFLILVIGVSIVSGCVRQKILVMDLEVINIDEADADVISSDFKKRVRNIQRFDVVASSQSFSTKKEAIVEGKKIGAEKVITGSINKVGKTYLLTGLKIDTSSGKIEKSVGERGKNAMYLTEKVILKLTKQEKSRSSLHVRPIRVGMVTSLDYNGPYLGVGCGHPLFEKGELQYLFDYARLTGDDESANVFKGSITYTRELYLNFYWGIGIGLQDKVSEYEKTTRGYTTNYDIYPSIEPRLEYRGLVFGTNFYVELGLSMPIGAEEAAGGMTFGLGLEF